jgi:hypothetical protein
MVFISRLSLMFIFKMAVALKGREHYKLGGREAS